MKIKISDIKKLFLVDIFFTINLICLFGLAFPNIKTGIMTSVIIILSLFIHKKLFWYLCKDVVFLFFLIINIGSIIFYFINGRPIEIYFASISYNLIPMLLYLIGRYVADLYSFECVCQKIFKVSIFLMGFGLFFYLLFPDFFYTYIGQDVDTFRWDRADYRFGSYISCANLGSLCVITIAIYFVVTKGVGKLKKSMYAIIIGLSLILCMQRSAWVVAIFILCVVYIFSNISFSKKVFGIVALLFLLILGFIFKERIFTEEQLNYFITRILNLDFSIMSGERTQQWMTGIRIFMNNPFGYGLGSLGHKAVPYGFGICCDGNYIRILGELGIVGFLLFVFLIIRAYQNIIKSENLYLFLILSAYCLQAIYVNIFHIIFCFSKMITGIGNVV